MSYTIKPSVDQKFLQLKSMNQINMDIVRQWSADVEKKSREMNIRKFLFDVRSTHNVSILLEGYVFAYRDFLLLNLSRDVRSAILISEEDLSHNFTETTLRSAGYDVRIFTDESSAVEWLEEEKH